MPAFQSALTAMNALSHPDIIDSINPELFGPGMVLSESVVAVGLQHPQLDVDRFAAYLDLLPQGIAEACRAVIQSALVREPRQPITFAWAPGYDWELQLWDVSDTATSRGGITLLLRSRYPSDAHPLTQAQS
jgi:hypothetical protein